jgi:hypothetical protein
VITFATLWMLSPLKAVARSGQEGED